MLVLYILYIYIYIYCFYIYWAYIRFNGCTFMFSSSLLRTTGLQRTACPERVSSPQGLAQYCTSHSDVLRVEVQRRFIPVAVEPEMNSCDFP